MENGTCKIHSGINARLESVERNITELWGKWNGMQKVIISLLLSNLIGIIILLITKSL